MAVTRAEVLAEAARPMAFFSHDSRAHDDIKCRRLLRRLGFEGYGRWWLLCELLASEDGHRLRADGEDGEILADELGLDLEGLASFVSTIADCGLVEVEGDVIRSDRMDRNAEYFGMQRAKGKRGGRPRKAS